MTTPQLAYAEVFQGKGENARQAVAFLRRGIAFFKTHGVEVERVTSDNGSGYVLRAHAIACRALGVRHTCIRAGRPRTNGKAERFIQTLLDEWAYVRIYGSSKERERQLQQGRRRGSEFGRSDRSLAPGSANEPARRCPSVVRPARKTVTAAVTVCLDPRAPRRSKRATAAAPLRSRPA